MSKADRFIEGYENDRAVICDGCNTRIDLSDADTVTEAKHIWNEHVRDECPAHE